MTAWAGAWAPGLPGGLLWGQGVIRASKAQSRELLGAGLLPEKCFLGDSGSFCPGVDPVSSMSLSLRPGRGRMII